MSEELASETIADVTTTDPVAFARAVAELPAGVFVFHGDEHLVIGANRAARMFFGDRPEIVGRPIREVYPEITGQQLYPLLDRVLATGEPFTAHEWRIIVEGHADGDERFVSFWLVPLSGPDGRRCGVGCQFVDVTDQVRRRRSVENDAATLRRRYAAAQDVVLTLQRSLLPVGLPVLPGVRIAAHYLVAAAEQAAGGDWFEAVPVDGRVVGVVGDVVGHGAEASAVMGQLRAVLVEFLLDGDDPGTAMARLERFAGRVSGARGATVCLAVIDPAEGTLRYVCAGHPPPLVVAADGSTRYLPAPGGGPLSLAGPPPRVGTATLAPDELLLMFSDGLVERSGQDQSVGLAELAEVASSALRLDVPSLRAADATDRVAELTVERMTRQGYQDDVTLLALRLTDEPVPDFFADVPAQLAARARLLHTGHARKSDPIDAASLAMSERASRASQLSTRAGIRSTSPKTTVGDHAGSRRDADVEVALGERATQTDGDGILGTHSLKQLVRLPGRALAPQMPRASTKPRTSSGGAAVRDQLLLVSLDASSAG